MQFCGRVPLKNFVTSLRLYNSNGGMMCARARYHIAMRADRPPYLALCYATRFKGNTLARIAIYAHVCVCYYACVCHPSWWFSPTYALLISIVNLIVYLVECCAHCFFLYFCLRSHTFPYVQLQCLLAILIISSPKRTIFVIQLIV